MIYVFVPSLGYINLKVKLFQLRVHVSAITFHCFLDSPMLVSPLSGQFSLCKKKAYWHEKAALALEAVSDATAKCVFSKISPFLIIWFILGYFLDV